MSKQLWPSWRYGPNGQSRIFEEHEQDQIPKGWEDHPSKVGKPEKGAAKKRGPKKAPATPVSAEEQEKARKEALTVLRQFGVEIADDASVDEVEAALDALESAEE